MAQRHLSALRFFLAALILVAAAAVAAPAQAAAVAKPIVDSTSAQARIVNGTGAAEGSWPFIVSLRHSSDNGHFCGGSVIADNLILTAAHCVTNPGTAQKAAAGSLYVVAKQTRLDQGTGETLQVAQVVINPAYMPASFAGDAALLVLKGRTTAPAIALADDAFEASALTADAWVWTAGWGSTTPNVPTSNSYGAQWPNQLMATALRISTPEACNSLYGVGYFTSSNLCVGRADSTFCNGDSGGPHVVQAANGSWQQIGITSFTLYTTDAAGRNWACQKNFAAVQRVAAIRDWIYATARGNGAATSADAGTQLGDFTAPSLTLKAHKAKARHAFRVTYKVVDNSKVSAETLVIKKGARTVAVAKTAFGAADGKAYSIRFKGLRKGTYQLQLTSRDKAGNVSRIVVAKLRVR
jgi:secreted trypsin-like serine protease